MNIGINIKNARIEKNISLKEMSENICVPKSTLSRYENDLTKPRIETFLRIAKYLNVTTDYLLGIKRKEKPQIK